MNFKPLGDRLLVEKTEEPTTTQSGIIIPDSAKEKPTTAKVIAVGNEVEEITEGDEIVFGKYSGTEITLDGNEYLILEQSDVLGLLK